MRLRSPLLATLLLAAAACSDRFAPSPANMAGTYAATQFVITTGDTRLDVLAAGGSITMTLTADGATTGTLFVPHGDDGSDLHADLTGTYRITGTQINFDQPGDTFVKDLTFSTAEGEFATNTLSGDTRIEVRMHRTGP